MNVTYVYHNFIDGNRKALTCIGSDSLNQSIDGGFLRVSDHSGDPYNSFVLFACDGWHLGVGGIPSKRVFSFDTSEQLQSIRRVRIDRFLSKDFWDHK